MYIIYITRTDYEHHFSQLSRVRVVLSRWTFHKKKFLSLGLEKNVINSKLVYNPFKEGKKRFCRVAPDIQPFLRSGIRLLYIGSGNWKLWIKEEIYFFCVYLLTFSLTLLRRSADDNYLLQNPSNAAHTLEKKNNLWVLILKAISDHKYILFLSTAVWITQK